MSEESGTLPPELLNNDPNGFAWGVWHDRAPKLVTQIRDAHPYGPAQRDALAALLDEISAGPMRPPPPGPPGHDLWTSWGADHFGRPWLDAPFLGSEAYFYHRLLQAVGFFGPGAWQGVDPFGHLKSAELRDPALEPGLAAIDTASQGQAKLLASLWGNRADLGFLIERAAPSADRQPLVADHSAELWAALGPAATVIFVTDNAGRELLADLVLIDHLLQHDLARTVTMHVKPRPYYVSDATAADVAACLQRLAATTGSAARIAANLHAAAAGGTLAIGTHEFYCAPWTYRRTPADLAAQFAQASLTIMKGDLNYRRLVSDRAWPPTTPFTQVTAYFPGPVATLRTLKSDVITGLAAPTVAALDATGQPWRTDGNHALIQISPPGTDRWWAKQRAPGC